MPTAPPTLALALEGGGFKQQAALAGLFPALLNAGHFTPEELMSAWARGGDGRLVAKGISTNKGCYVRGSWPYY